MARWKESTWPRGPRAGVEKGAAQDRLGARRGKGRDPTRAGSGSGGGLRDDCREAVGRLLRAYCGGRIPGVEFSYSVGWGRIGFRQGVIGVEGITDDRCVLLLTRHLDAAVQHADAAWESDRQEQERARQRHREQQRLAADRDADLTRRFRQVG